MKADKLIVKIMPDRTVRFSDGVDWYDTFGDYLHASDQRDFEAELWREGGRKPDAVMTMTSGGKTEEIKLYHQL